MKTLNESSYTYLGIKDCWHVFVSKQTAFDPEVLYLYRARMIKLDGTSEFFDPITKDERKTFNDTILVRGTTKDGLQYCMPVNLDQEFENSAVCVSSSMCEGRSPKRIVARA